MKLEKIIDKSRRFLTKAAKKPLQSVDYIAVHHTSRTYDTPGYVRLRHIFKRDWDDIGYHYMIGNGKALMGAQAFPLGMLDGILYTKDGKLYKGRDEKLEGAHVYGHNKNSLAVCLIGDLDVNKPTEKQIDTLINFLAEKAREYKLPAERILGHGEFSGATKSCPGKNVDMDYVRAQVAERLARRA